MSQVKLGDKNIPFIYQGNELLYPNPIKDGLILYYDFKGMKNSDMTKGVAKDLSGMNNDGTLQNFVYTSESGYNDGLKFDNVDDVVSLSVDIPTSFTLSITIDFNISKDVQFLCGGYLSAFYIRKNYNDLHASVITESNTQIISTGGNRFFYKVSSSGKSKCQVTLSVDDTTKTMSIYGNGDLLNTRETGEQLRENKLNKLGVWQGNTNLDGKILSTTMYNRALTDQEIQQNYQLEKERWGL